MVDHFDSPWKEAVSSCLPDFFAFHFPDVHAQIDWTQPVNFLEQELLSVALDHSPQSSFVDKLVSVQRVDGHAEWVMIHIEIQCQPQAAFAERMFLYHLRLYERHRQPIASLALLADDRPDWRPDSFQYNLFGCKLDLHFPVAKLLDWSGSDALLADQRNPFAIVTRAHLATRTTRDDPARRERNKVQLVRELYRSGLDRQRIVSLFRVIDWMMKLPKEHDLQFRQTIATLEEELQVRYVTSIERLAKEEGLQQGLERGLEQGLERGLEQSLHQGRARLLRLLTQRFGELPTWAKDKLASATEAQLDAWTDAFLNSASIAEILDQPRPH